MDRMGVRQTPWYASLLGRLLGAGSLRDTYQPNSPYEFDIKDSPRMENWSPEESIQTYGDWLRTNWPRQEQELIDSWLNNKYLRYRQGIGI